MTSAPVRLDRDGLNNPLERDRGPLRGLAHRVDLVGAEDMKDGVVSGHEEGMHVFDGVPLSSEVRRGRRSPSADGLNVPT